MTLEGCLLLPIFLFFMMTILLGLEIVRLQSNVWAGLCDMQKNYYYMQSDRCLRNEVQEVCLEPHQVLEYLDGCANGSLCLLDTPLLMNHSDTEGSGHIEVSVSYRIKPFICWLPLYGTDGGTMTFQDRLVAHDFSGYRGSDRGEGILTDGEYVYVTPDGERYHCSRECVSLRIRIEAVSVEELNGRRNRSGGKYAPCERCHPVRNGLLYITAEGDRYHAQSDCSSLKRTVRMVSPEEAVAEGKSACRKCNG